jgi:alkylated DNA repair protein alkB family protein 8
LTPPSQGKMDQLTINDYMPGDGIPPHFDTHSPFEEVFVALSIGSGITMSFKSPTNLEKHIYIPERALIIFSGEARYAWYHTISQRKVDKVGGKLIFRRRRISLTFRKIKTTPCQCKYPFFCDSQGYDPVKEKLKKEKEKKRMDEAPKSEEETKMLEMVQNLKEDKPTDLEKKFVYEIYEKIAPHFSHTRYKPWPKIEKFLMELPAGTLIADVGTNTSFENIYLLFNFFNINL